MIYSLIKYDIFINYKIYPETKVISHNHVISFITLAVLSGVLITLERSLNELDLQSWRCCLSARGYSTTAGWEGNCLLWGAQPPQFLCELKVKPLMLQQLCCKTSHHSHQNAFTASPTKPGWGRAEALTATDTRLNQTEKALISASVKVIEPIHSTTQSCHI